MPRRTRTEKPDGEVWSAAEFEDHGQRILRWISDYLLRPEDHKVFPRVRPGALREALPKRPPSKGQDMREILIDFQSLIVPANTHWNHPGFLAYFSSSGSMPGILAETLSAALNINGMLWRSSPAATELEEVVLDWLRQLLGLPRPYWGVIQDTASVSNLVAVVAARHRVPEVRERGLAARGDLSPLRLYVSKEAHSSVEKAAIVAGLGRQAVRKIETDSAFRMSYRGLEKAVAHDRRNGDLPFAVFATAGTTSTTSVDPMSRISGLCKREGLWFHIDAAYAGSAAILPEKRRLFKGWETADSIVVNPHKWLFCPIDLSVLYVRDRENLKESLSLVPADYLRSSEEDVVNFMDYGIALGRRFRSLKLWLVLRVFGREGLQERLREHIRLARFVARRIDGHELLQRVAPVPFSTVCFRLQREGDSPETANERNDELLRRVNASGEVFLSSTRLNGLTTLRIAIGNLRSNRRWVGRAMTLLEHEAERVWAAKVSRGR